MSTEMEENAPAPRLCHVVRWANFEGYGFNLHSDKLRNAQLIGKVDENSPAEAAGLKKGDRIIEVNGINITNENHKQVVERIKAVPDETRLLVVDPETDSWYQERKIVVRGTQKNVIYLQNSSNTNGLTKEDTPSLSNSDQQPEIDHPKEEEEIVQKVSTPVSIKNEPNVNEEEPKKPSRKSSVSSSKSEVEVHRPPEVPVESEPDYQESLFSEIKPRSLSEARREFFSQDPESNKVDLVALGFGPNYSPHNINYNLKAPEKAEMEVLHEKVSVNKDNTADELASKLVGFRQVEDETPQEEHEYKHVHFMRNADDRQTPVLNGHDHGKTSPYGIEVIEEVVTRSPAFDSRQEDEKEHVSEKIEVHRHDAVHSPHDHESKGKDSGHEDTHSNSNSVSSADSSSVKDLSARQATYDVTLSDDARTPSPSPAVISQRGFPTFPLTSNGSHSEPAAVENQPKPAVVSRPSPHLYGSLTLHLTAQEMRAQLAQRTKHDPRKQQIDLRKKYEMINNM